MKTNDEKLQYVQLVLYKNAIKKKKKNIQKASKTGFDFCTVDGNTSKTKD